jgi:hypothetical protein
LIGVVLHWRNVIVLIVLFHVSRLLVVVAALVRVFHFVVLRNRGLSHLYFLNALIIGDLLGSLRWSDRLLFLTSVHKVCVAELLFFLHWCDGFLVRLLLIALI